MLLGYFITVQSDEGVNPAEVLHGFSLAILCIFLLEVSDYTIFS